MSNSFGRLWRITTYGESHGSSIGVIIDGCPAGLELSIDEIQKELDRRRPGQSDITTQRKETDKLRVQSGIFKGETLGTPIHLQLLNKDARSKDYSKIKDQYRPSHADYTYDEKYGRRDYRGGGRSSARETACRVAAGAVAKQFLKHHDIDVYSFVRKVHEVDMDESAPGKVQYEDIDKNIVRCPEKGTAKKMIELISKAQKEGETLGGIIDTHIPKMPTGLGEPVYDKLHARLASAILSINACKGFEYGSGFSAADMKGSEHNDRFLMDNNGVKTSTNFSGGIQGGISNGMPIYFSAVFKPVATILQKQKSVNSKGDEIEMEVKGRHDPCVLPRAVPIVEAMTALVIADFLLLHKTTQL
jgi:chorismate synthase